MKKKTFFLLLTLLLLLAGLSTYSEAQEAKDLITKSYRYMRGNSSVSTLIMAIHHPDFQRTCTIEAWTRGDQDSIFFISAPPKDAGNGTLKLKHEMWMYNPKIGSVIKLPPSMMSQKWMGSDFSNDDLSKTDSILLNYTYTLESTSNVDGKKVYVIKCMPKPEAPVVWGMQKITVREDLVMLKQGFFDEELNPVKTLTMGQVQMMGGKLFPKHWKMQESGTENKYTTLDYKEITFDKELPDRLFTLTNLRNPRR